MEWRYYGITLTGLKRAGTHSLERYLDTIRHLIQERRWTQQVPAIRTGIFERTTAFVFFAHVEDAEDLPCEVPLPIREIIQKIKYIGNLIRPTRNGGHTLNEIRNITRGNLETNSIGSLDSLFRDLELVDVRIPPLDLSASEEEFRDASNATFAHGHERLLAYLSACGEGSWERFARAAIALGLARADQHLRLRSLIRRLILLGHLQTSVDQQRWSVCPITLVARESEPDAFILCGSRTFTVLSDLEEQIGVPEQISQPLDDGPACLLFRVAPEKLATVTQAGGLTVFQSGSFATRLAAVLPDYETWLGSLASDGSLRMASFPECRRFDGSEFVALACPHQEGERVVGQAGLYQFTPHEGAPLFRYLDSSGVWRSGDYHALRYAGTVAGRGRTVTRALFAGGMAVPLSQRWPLLHERCLVLVSGRLPALISDQQWLKYTGVSRELLGSLQGKLAFDIEETDDA